MNGIDNFLDLGGDGRIATHTAHLLSEIRETVQKANGSIALELDRNWHDVGAVVEARREPRYRRALEHGLALGLSQLVDPHESISSSTLVPRHALRHAPGRR